MLFLKVDSECDKRQKNLIAIWNIFVAHNSTFLWAICAVVLQSGI